MDSPVDIALSPSYARDPSDAIATATSADANASPASFGLVSAGAPPSTGLTGSLFMAPRPTSVGGGVPAPTVTRAPFSKLPNAPEVKKTIKKVSRKKKKAVAISTRPPKKKLACHTTNAVATKVPASLYVLPASSFVPLAANAHNVFDGIPTSFNDEIYMNTMGVGSNNSHWSQTNDVHLDDHEFAEDEDGEGIVDAPKGSEGNYTMDEDVLLCNTLLKVSRYATVGGDRSIDAYWNQMKEHMDLYNKSGIDREEKKTKKGMIRKRRPFTLPHCNDALKDDEKWRPREGVDEESNKHKRTIVLYDDEEESLSDGSKRSPTPNSVAYSKPNRPSGRKKEGKEKKKRKGDDELKNAIEAIVNTRKEANEVRKMARNQDAAGEERRLATEERRVADEEKKVALEEKKLAMEERPRLLEWENYLFFIMDTSTLDKQ
ncbi:putative receptor protein kinase ZmPK1 [Hordeum vulgare]|nr:putative receptor protein kinase ZmPK1 [Hordeum vulgare]